MQFLRCGNHDRLDVIVIDEFMPVMGMAPEPERGRLRSGAFRVRGANHFKPGPQLGIEYRADGLHGHTMGFAHIAATYDANADFSHDPRHIQNCFCNRLQNS